MDKFAIIEDVHAYVQGVIRVEGFHEGLF
jgi:hypothetical protein